MNKIDLNDYPNFFHRLQPNVTVLTPNRRLSIVVHNLYQRFQQAHGNRTWPTPDILPINSWIERTWKEINEQSLSLHASVLSSQQEFYLWEQIIEACQESTPLLRLSETADLIKSAWELLKLWQVNLDHSAFNHEDFVLFVTWINQFIELCTTQQFITQAELPIKLSQCLAKVTVKNNHELILIGFTELSPAIADLLQLYKNHYGDVTFSNLPIKHAICKRLSFNDLDEELLGLARFAKYMHERNPAASIACVIPGLNQLRDKVEQIFSAVFANSDSLGIKNDLRLFNVSAGKNFLNYPIIQIIFSLLNLNKPFIHVEKFYHLLTSAFIGEAECEKLQRAEFDSFLRQKNISRVKLNHLLEHKSYRFAAKCPGLAVRLSEIQKLFKFKPSSQTFQQWAQFFNKALNVMGWPGERSLNSAEFQTVEAWLALLNEYTRFDYVSAPVNYEQALKMLMKMAAKHVFQPKSPDAPIQILGVLEAAGIPFDYTWITGLDSSTWPAAARPNPFIPKSLQRELHMPHATAMRELKFCQGLLNQFKLNSSQLFVSYALKTEEVENQASSLIKDIEEVSFTDIVKDRYQPKHSLLFDSRVIESFVDEQGPVITGEIALRGGTSVIKQQALCPFKAFAEWRLFAQPLEQPTFGLKASERGTLIHKVLEMIWQQLKNHHGLETIDEQALVDLIKTSIDLALKTISPWRTEERTYLTLEKQRLFKIVSEWLSLEKYREPFEVVANEKITEIKLNQLKLSIKIDRIDLLPNGQHLIIDYKTSRYLEISQLLGERPEEPQLPLYALTDVNHTGGISFAQLIPGNHCFKGISKEATNIKGIKVFTDVNKITHTNWQEQINEWQHTFEQLSSAFCQGIAIVDPKEKATCTWCSLKPLCRIQEI